MILKIATISLVSAILWLHGANGASYSKVFVQSGGPDVVPVEYFNYGAPAVISSPQIARLSAPPVGSVVPVQTVSNVIPPCVSPCVIPGPSITAAAPSAKFITYNSPNVPVVVAPNKDNAYEYSYVVYDENTGDRKAQRELSDGAVVRGEYSFLQPDGYVREVQYRADDLTGFNVVVKRILPETVGEHKKPEHSDAAPCPIKHEELKVEVVPEKENHNHEHEGHDHGLEDDGHSHENHDHGHEGHGHNGHSHDDHDHGHEGHGNEGHSHDDHDHGHEGHGHSNEDHGHEHVEPTHQEHDVDAPTHEAVHVIEHIEVHEPEKESVHEQEHVHEPEPEHKEPHQPEHEHASEAELEPEHASQQITEAVHVEPLEVHDETHVVTHQAMVEVVDPLHEESAPNLVVSYEEVLRCLQAKGEAHKGLNFSPLTYIILPASNRPC